MRIGITYDLKTDTPTYLFAKSAANGYGPPSLAEAPDDLQEEFDSPVTIEAIASVLRGLGHEVVKLGDGREMLEKLLADPPDFVFNFAEGQGIGRAREARVPAVLEMLGIPYTGSDPLTQAATLDKDCARRLVASAGVMVPEGFLIEPDDDLDAVIRRRQAQPLAGRGLAIVKPAWEGSSKGIRGNCLVHDASELRAVVDSLRRDYWQPLLVEEFIAGDELTVGIVGNDPPEIIGIMRVVPNTPTEQFVYSLEVKRDFRRQVRYECPPPLPESVLQRTAQAALAAHRVLGCRDVARIDFRLRNGVPYFLEVNPLPGLNPESSDLVILAGLRNWTYEELVGRILQAALKRAQPHCQPHASGNPASRGA
jgi:D-alanine-D-alanine ligase